jgi:hypothetical protein
MKWDQIRVEENISRELSTETLHSVLYLSFSDAIICLWATLKGWLMFLFKYIYVPKTNATPTNFS